jgi:hypothetical protein
MELWDETMRDPIAEAGEQRTLNEAQRLLGARFSQPPFEGFHAMRMNFSDRLWILVTSIERETMEFRLEPGESADTFVVRVLESITADVAPGR